MNNFNNTTFIGTRGTVVAIDQNSGNEMWRTQLPGSFYAPVTIFFEEGKVFCGSNGKVYILCSKSGRLIAKNDLVGQGYGVVTFTSKKTEVVQQPQQVQYPQLGFQQAPQLMNEQQSVNQNQNQQEQEQQPTHQNIQPPLYQNIPVQQESLYFEQPQQNQQNNNQSLYNFFPSLNVQQREESQRLLDEDEEYARSLDIELNGNNRRNNNNQIYQMNNFVGNRNMNNGYNQNQRLATLSDLNRAINNNIKRNNRNNNISTLFSHDFNNVFNENINMYRKNRVQVEISINDIIFVGLNSFITALNKNTAEEVWRTQVPTSYGLPLSLIFNSGKINVASGGHVYCLNAYTGKELWRNTLPGLRYTNVSIVSSNGNNSYNPNSNLLSLPGN